MRLFLFILIKLSLVGAVHADTVYYDDRGQLHQFGAKDSALDETEAGFVPAICRGQCSPTDPLNSLKTYIGGTDDRTPVTGARKAELQDRVGMVYNKALGVGGTAFLFMYNNIVLTAAHNIFNEDGTYRTEHLSDVKFATGENLFYSNTHNTHEIIDAVRGPHVRGEEGDWAILVLGKPIQNAEPFQPLMEDEIPFADRKGLKLELLGFHADKENLDMYHSPCIDRGIRSAVKNVGTLFKTNCDNYQGASGSPIFMKGTRKVVGVQYGNDAGKDKMGNPITHGPADKANSLGLYINDAMINAAKKMNRQYAK